jgi:hypothetical protein
MRIKQTNKNWHPLEKLADGRADVDPQLGAPIDGIVMQHAVKVDEARECPDDAFRDAAVLFYLLETIF